jgi:hypothetical protein
MMNKLLCAAFVLAGCTILGCGKSGSDKDLPRATVTGKVTLPGGAPLPGGTINFRSTKVTHLVGTGEIQADGTYEAKDVPQGDCKVTIDNSGLKSVKGSAGYTPPEGTKTGAPGTKYVEIKKKYSNEAETDLTTNVGGSTHKYDIELK